MHNFLVCFAFLAVTIIGPSRAFGQALECVMTAKASVTDEQQSFHLDLHPGDRVYSRWTSGPLSAFLIRNDQFVEVNGLDGTGEQIDCQASGRSPTYPIVLSGREGRKLLFEQFGMLIDADEDARKAIGVAKGNKKCFYIGDGHISLELTDDAAKQYQGTGFSPSQACMVLTSGQVRFDPETGERLPTYVVVDSNNGKSFRSDELPFFAPKCFAKGKTTVKKDSFSARSNPLGCNVLYHPWSGRKLERTEVSFFSANAVLDAAGDAGEAMEDSESLAKDSNRKVTSAAIQAVRERAASAR